MNTAYQITVVSDCAEATQALAARLGAVVRAGDLVALFGELGAGKTCFVQGLARGLGIADNVTSPTFILMRRHPGAPTLCHADAYRLESAAELEDLGLEDALGEAVVAVEWAERVMEALPAERVEVRLTVVDDETRRVEITARGEDLRRRVWEAFS